MTADLPLFWRLGFPPLLLVFTLACKVWAPPGFYSDYIESEQGLIELATAFLAFAASWLALRAGQAARRQLPPAQWIWFVLLALGCFYIGGEEISWGQQLLHWQTPEAIEALNRQHETNLHNMSTWFNEKPRILVELGVLVGGVLMPTARLLRRRRLVRQHGFAYWLWPTNGLLLTGLLAVLVLVPKRYEQAAGVPLLPVNVRWSELQEYYFALFLWLYAWSALRRLRREPA